MGKVIKLPPRDPAPPPGGEADRQTQNAGPVTQASARLIETVGDLIRALEASHRRLRVLIDSIPDAEVSARLARDLAVLSAALRDAKAKAANVGLARHADDWRSD